MLFNSVHFIFVFLPVVLIVFCLLARRYGTLATGWIALASLAFYAYWSTEQLWVLLVSIAVNYIAGRAIDRNKGAIRRALLALALTANVALLGYFKYFGFFATNIKAVFGLPIEIASITLPLGISFFTFTQIAYLVDVYRSKVYEFSPLKYFLFVTYFPHLIAGPILHHAEMIPQFKRDNYVFKFERLAVGLTVFVIGLFKKVVLADTVAPYVGPVFSNPDVTVAQAWIGVLAYTFQIYFDFSGYCDMAIGISYLFGIRLPLNFESPYKATSIIDFWRRWHMTLSRFLRDYLYISLGGNRRGPARRYFNLLATMVLGGLWHGASWTFVIWGALHGVYLVINHVVVALSARVGWSGDTVWWRGLGWAATFLGVIVGWVFFRADTLSDALSLLGAMFGLNGKGLLPQTGRLTEPAVVIGVLLLISVLAPNTQQIMAKFQPQLDDVAPVTFSWKLTGCYAVVTGLMAAAVLVLMTKESPFLYFQF